MSVLEVLNYPHEILRATAEPISAFDAELKALADDMVETMYHYRGIGLAATQVGITKRIFVLDVSDDQNDPQIFINPKITAHAGKVSSTEGCLSLPDFRESISRHETVTVVAQDIEGQQFTVEADGLFSICLQHELDHLNGVMFTDHLSFLKKQFFAKWLKKNQS